MIAATPRPLIGPLLSAVGAVHVALTPVVAPVGFRGLLRAGVVDAVEGGDGGEAEATDRALAFWFATTGVGLAALGWAVTALERTPGPLPRGLPVVLAGLGPWGVVQLPRSPFWVLLVLAGVTERARRRPPPAGS